MQQCCTVEAGYMSVGEGRGDTGPGRTTPPGLSPCALGMEQDSSRRPGYVVSGELQVLFNEVWCGVIISASMDCPPHLKQVLFGGGERRTERDVEAGVAGGERVLHQRAAIDA